MPAIEAATKVPPRRKSTFHFRVSFFGPVKSRAQARTLAFEPVVPGDERTGWRQNQKADKPAQPRRLNAKWQLPPKAVTLGFKEEATHA